MEHATHRQAGRAGKATEAGEDRGREGYAQGRHDRDQPSTSQIRMPTACHLVGPNMVWVTDLISPRGAISRSPNTTAVGDALRKASIVGSTIVGGHGTTAKQAEIEPAHDPRASPAWDVRAGDCPKVKSPFDPRRFSPL